MELSAALTQVALYGLLPFWIFVGIGDYVCHRITHIEVTSGAKEAWIHWLMILQLGTGILLVLFFEVNALVIGLLVAICLLHYATGLWDLRYAYKSPRVIMPLEQHLHSYLEILPLLGLVGVMNVHWSQTGALFGIGTEPAIFSLKLNLHHWNSGYAAFLGFIAVCGVFIPYGEELWRCRSACKKISVP